MIAHSKLTVLVAVMATFSLLALGNVVSYHAGYAQNSSTNKLAIADGIASGDVTDHTAIIWSRANTQAQMHVQYDSSLAFSHPKVTTASVNQTTDFAGHIKLDSLSPDTVYYYRVWFSTFDNKSKESSRAASVLANSMTGTFKTSPNQLTSRPVSFVVGGDLGGQNYCRRAGGEGYPIFSVMQALSPSFLVFNGDQIYGDNACSARVPPM